MKIKEISCKTCMTKSKLTDYVINPYIGCQHSCAYCYADFIKRFQNIKEKWGEFVNVKSNCPELLEKELEKNKKGTILMSTICDCYMPLEKELELTKKILETIEKSKYRNKFKIEILTKSELIQRDFKIIKNLDAEIGLSIGSLNKEFAKIIEPNASSPEKRIKTLAKAKEQGIKTFGFISPVTIFTDLEEIFKELKKAKCAYVWIEIINARPSTKNKMFPIIKKEFPEKLKEFEKMFEDYNGFCLKVEKQARELEKTYNLKIKEIVIH